MSTVVTFANFDFGDTNYLGMARMWLRSVRRNHDGEILVISKESVEPYLKGIVEGVEFRVITTESTDQIVDIERKINYRECQEFARHNIFYKLYHLCHLNMPFIAMDMDMCVLSPLRDLEKICTGKGYSVVEHRNFHHFPGQPDKFMNGGLQVVNDPSILNWEEILKTANDPGFRRRIEGSEQAILYNHFARTGYDYRTPGLTEHWNAFVATVELKKENGQWRAYLDGEPAHIVHYCGTGYKPWVIKCPLYEELSV